MKTITTIESTPEEIASMVAKAVDKRIELLKNESTKEEEPVGVPEVSKFLKRSQNWVRKETNRGIIPGHRSPGEKTTFYYYLSEITDWIKKGKIKTREEVLKQADNYVNSKNF